MMPTRTLAMAGVTHSMLMAHLLSDGNEAAAILVCAPSPGPRQRLVVRQAILVPHEACPVRKPDAIVWPGAYIEDAIDIAEPEGLRDHPAPLPSRRLAAVLAYRQRKRCARYPRSVSRFR